MLSKKLQNAMNKQMNAELYSAYLYFSMSAYFESTNLKGAAHWMRCQAQEELFHATKFFTHITERGGRALMTEIAAPATEWDSALAVYEASYAHEVEVSRLIDNLVELAAAEGDNASAVFLQWFVTEQVEEEASADAVVQKLKLVGDSSALFMLDAQLAQRQVSFAE